MITETDLEDIKDLFYRGCLLENSRDSIVYFLDWAISHGRAPDLKKQAHWVGNLLQKGRTITPASVVEKNIDFALAGDKADLEYLLEDLLSGYEAATGYVFSDAIHEKVAEICSRQRPHRDYKRKPSQDLKDDEFMYALVTCEMILEAGVNADFFTIDGREIVRRVRVKDSTTQINTTQALALLIFGNENNIETLNKKKKEAIKKGKAFMGIDSKRKKTLESVSSFYNWRDQKDRLDFAKRLQIRFEKCKEAGKTINFSSKNICSIKEFITHLIEKIA